MCEYKRGDICWMYFQEKEGSSRQAGWRPGLITANKFATKYSTVFQCVPITTELKRLDLPVHILLKSGTLKKESMALVELEDLVDTCDFREKIGEVSEEDMDEIDFAIIIQRGMNMNRLLNRLIINQQARKCSYVVHANKKYA